MGTVSHGVWALLRRTGTVGLTMPPRLVDLEGMGGLRVKRLTFQIRNHFGSSHAHSDLLGLFWDCIRAILGHGAIQGAF